MSKNNEQKIDLERLRSDFADISLARQLMIGVKNRIEVERVITDRQIYDYAIGRIHRPDFAIETYLRANPGARARYVTLAVRYSWAASEVARAASSQEYPNRIIHERKRNLKHKLSVIEDSGQVFLVLEVDKRTKVSEPLTLTVINPETGETIEQPIPTPVAGFAQIIVAVDSPILNVLQSSQSVVTLSQNSPET